MEGLASAFPTSRIQELESHPESMPGWFNIDLEYSPTPVSPKALENSTLPITLTQPETPAHSQSPLGSLSTEETNGNDQVNRADGTGDEMDIDKHNDAQGGDQESRGGENASEMIGGEGGTEDQVGGNYGRMDVNEDGNDETRRSTPQRNTQPIKPGKQVDRDAGAKDGTNSGGMGDNETPDEMDRGAGAKDGTNSGGKGDNETPDEMDVDAGENGEKDGSNNDGMGDNETPNGMDLDAGQPRRPRYSYPTAPSKRSTSTSKKGKNRPPVLADKTPSSQTPSQKRAVIDENLKMIVVCTNIFYFFYAFILTLTSRESNQRLHSKTVTQHMFTWVNP